MNNVSSLEQKTSLGEMEHLKKLEHPQNNAPHSEQTEDN